MQNSNMKEFNPDKTPSFAQILQNEGYIINELNHYSLDFVNKNADKSGRNRLWKMSIGAGRWENPMPPLFFPDFRGTT